jgi:adenosylcobinamide amidohydrolase
LTGSGSGRPLFAWSELHVGSYGFDAPALATLVWTFDVPLLAASTAPVGGGVGTRNWVVNVQVPDRYGRTDTDRHVGEIVSQMNLDATPGCGVGMLTAADVVRCAGRAVDGDAYVEATVGLTRPVWAAESADDDARQERDRDGVGDDDGVGGGDQDPLNVLVPRKATSPPEPGTVNIVAFVAARHGDAALLNLLCTATEAKAQALFDVGVPGTGTASDAVTLLCPAEGPVEPFGGPRSTYGAQLARAVHAAVLSGANEGLDPAADPARSRR